MDQCLNIEAIFGSLQLLRTSSHQDLKTVCSKYLSLSAEEFDNEVADEVLNTLSSLIIDKSLTECICQCFASLVPTIVCQTLASTIICHQRKCIILSNLLSSHPDILNICLIYFEKEGPPWCSSNNLSKSKNKKQKLDSSVMDLDIVVSCWNFLIHGSRFAQIWNWNDFICRYLNHQDVNVKWVAASTIASVFGMSENQRHNFLSVNFSQDEISDLSNKHYHLLFPQRSHNCHTDEGCKTFKNPNIKKGNSEALKTIDVMGISLNRSTGTNMKGVESLILVESTKRNLRELAVGVAMGKGICLGGIVGSGKTALVEQLAQLTDSYLIKVQLGEETDSKILIGSYKCTDLPGEFVWQPGVLTQAVTKGCWLLLEDIDCATSDVAALLANLLETKSLSVPGQADTIPVSNTFRLFLTHRYFESVQGSVCKHTISTELLSKHWHLVHLDPLTNDELIVIIKKKFPVLNTVADKMVSAYKIFNEADSLHKGSRSGRLISTRDLLKWCRRVGSDFDVSSQSCALRLLQDAIDLFCSSYSSQDERLELASMVSAKLGIVKMKAEYFCQLHRPALNLTDKFCQAGRATLHRLDVLDPTSSNIKFALTQSSSCLLERIAVCLSLGESALLVGETGTGKTSTLQLLAHHTRNKLIVINMNQQSDSADLLGGYKPVDMKCIISPIRNSFEKLFRSFFDVKQNAKFLEHISYCFGERKWKTLMKLMKHSQTAAVKRLRSQKIDKSDKGKLNEWLNLGEKIKRLEIQLNQDHAAAMAFAFIQGSLIEAIQNGYWVLLDEINLASAETLQCLSGLLEGGSLTLVETGDLEQVKRHPNFRLMAAMNPATDVGKKELPPGIRNRFTELFVFEQTDVYDLSLLVQCYLPNLPSSMIDSVVKFYLDAKQLAANKLSDGIGHKPHYSLRTLCRALSVASSNLCGSIQRSLYEALSLSFLTQLDTPSYLIVQNMITKSLNVKGELKSILNQPIPCPSPINNYVCFEGYWVRKGPNKPFISDKYLVTGSVRRNLKDLSRIVSLSNHPILIQGETSVGKTSLIDWLAKAAGHNCVRLNNHQHTDLQEYIGAYSAHPKTGNLVFIEGVLVEAMRNGHWIILDELNLAPSEVLEALNRVLDDNRELFIPETQTLIKAHPSFRLFATQNPPGLYAGRKVLSKAFRNRFIELHFNEIPPKELEDILHHRCAIPMSYCKKMISVMQDLQVRRRGSAAFAGKQGFMTLRDLFRWGERYRLANVDANSKFYDWDQHLADEGYLVLAGRVRKFEEDETIRQVLHKRLKRSVNLENLFTLSDKTSLVTKHILERLESSIPDEFSHIVWTFNIRKLFVLVSKACEFVEPVLIVGETGCGKTTVCQLLSKLNRQSLYSVNCHQHSESSDMLGSLRPVRHRDDKDLNKLFEWVDGPLINAMKTGGLFLADEISLADDSVLERLNSLLEPERKLLISEKGSDDNIEIIAETNFRFIGTMNPGGDYGKKELSPALRNRLTEIWCEGPSSTSDLISIIEHNLRSGLSLGNQQDGSSGIGKIIVDFIQWFHSTEIGKRITVSIRDILAWVKFINICTSDESLNKLDAATALVHGGCLTLLDGIGSASTSTDNVSLLKSFKSSCIEYLVNSLDKSVGQHPDDLEFLTPKKGGDTIVPKIIDNQSHFGIIPFIIEKGPVLDVEGESFLFEAPTTCLNALRILRSLQIPSRAVLLEGNPGVGKTSLVTALAHATGHQITRINLSEQTDVTDLFGADLPVEGEGTFAWRDGPFLKALKDAHWILLDELNLASQSVVEGLNSVLDHRGEIFIPELGKSFTLKPSSTRIFGCQNPQRQGGARKGLPQSFLNRFTQVFIDALSKEDLIIIVKGLFPELSKELISKMVEFCNRLSGIGPLNGGPWEWNLRDLSYWAKTISNNDPGSFLSTVVTARLRNNDDKQKVYNCYKEVFGNEYPLILETPVPVIVKNQLQIGKVTLKRKGETSLDLSQIELNNNEDRLMLRCQTEYLKHLALCVNNKWMPILVGGCRSGKTSTLQCFANLVGKKLHTMPINSAMDTTELLGAFEQADFRRELEEISKEVKHLLRAKIINLLINNKIDLLNSVLSSYHKIFSTSESKESDCSKTNLKEFEMKLNNLIDGVKGLKGGGEEILNKLKQVENRFGQDGLKGGGTFTWVDSLLVKCLESGDWLVLDNVNLSSGSIIDRLNGLLEPNGLLIIGERGIPASGQQVVIKPHPDFRIFLTMDPKYGEISRAMRNRGIEIYFNPMEIDGLHPLDLNTILYDIGFTYSRQRVALIDIHLALHQLFPGVIELSCFLDGCKLVKEKASRGMNLLETVRSVFRKTYSKSGLMSNDMKELLFITLDDCLKKAEKELSIDKLEMTEWDSFPLDGATLSTLRLQVDSCLSIVEQQASILVSIFNLMKTTPGRSIFSRTIKDVLGPSFDHPSKHSEYLIMDVIHLIVITYFRLASPGDARQRCRKLVALSESIEANQKNVQFVELIANSARLFQSLVVDNTRGIPFYSPLDQRLYCGQLLPVNEGKPTDWSKQNKLAVLMYYKVANRPSVNQNQPTDHRTMTIMQYSEALYSGKISDTLTTDVLLCEIYSLMSEFDEVFVSSLTCNETTLDTNESCDLLYSVAWKSRLCGAADSRLLDSKSHSSVSHASKTLLLLHYKWFVKHTVPVLLKLISSSKIIQKKSIKLLKTIKKIVDSLECEKLKLVSYSKRLVRQMKPPHPLSSTQQCDLSKMLRRLEVDYGTWCFKKPEDIKKRILRIVNPDGNNAREKLICATKLIQLNKDLNFVETLLTEVEDYFRNKEMTDSEIEVSKIGGEMWPILELIGMELNTIVRRNLQKGIPDWGAEAESWLSHSCAVAPTTVGSLHQALAKASDREGNDELMTAMVALTQHMTYSSAVNRPHLWLQSGRDDGEFDDVNSSNPLLQHIVCQHQPLLSVYLTKLFSRPQDELTNLGQTDSTLRAHTCNVRQKKFIQKLIWSNSALILSPQLDFLANEKECLELSYKSLLKDMLKATNKHSICDNADNVIPSLIEQFEILKESCSLAPKESDSPISEIISSTQILVDLMEELKRETDETALWSLVGRGWTHIGRLQFMLFSCLDIADPVHKKSIKSQYASQEASQLEILLTIDELYKTIVGFKGDWPFEKSHRQRIDFLKEKLDKLSKDVAVRPYPPMYNDIVQDLNSGMRSIACGNVLKPLIDKLSCLKIGDQLIKSSSPLKEAKVWLISLEALIDKITSLYSLTYPDIVSPPLLAMAQLHHGMRITSSLFYKLSIGKLNCQKLEQNLTQLIDFPLPSVESALKLIQLITSDNLLNLVGDKHLNQSHEQSIHVKIRLAKISILIIRGLTGYCDWFLIRDTFLSVLDYLVSCWEIQLKEIELKTAQQESIYVYRKTLSEEEQDKLEIAELFPTFRDEDFGDLEEVTQLEDVRAPIVPKSKLPTADSLKLSSDDIDRICNLHSLVVRENVLAHWVEGKKSPERRDYHVKSLFERLDLFHKAIDSNFLYCGKRLDEKVVVATIVSLGVSNSEKIIKDESLYDFYRDSNVDEVKKCLPVLKSLFKRIEELRIEWPDHPTLKQITEVINRILGFEAESPLARFLTGLELLLARLNCWEENAHAGVSLSDHATTITNVVISWRRIELHAWKGALYSASQRAIKKASRWWFYLYSTIKSYLTNDADKLDNLICSLEMFLEKSTLGEYSTRLQLLFTFHCHCQLLPPSNKQREVSTVLWNLFLYYHQFSQSIGKKIKDLTSPVEKKVKDFVKIARWNDINYWSVKAAVEKTHRTLHKYIKEFEGILQQSANTALAQPEKINLKDNYKVPVKKYISSKVLPEPDQVDGSTLIPGYGDYFNKSLKLSKQIFIKCSYPRLINNLNQLILSIEDVGTLLAQSDVDPLLPKEKKKSIAKALLQRKRKVVSDLFKSLSNAGLSYRLGLLAIDKAKEFTLMEPINVHIALKHFNRRGCDADWFSSWKNTDNMFMSAIARSAQLKTASGKPHKDVGPQNVDRIKGFSFHLLEICFEEKKSLTEITKQLYLLRFKFEEAEKLTQESLIVNKEIYSRLRNDLNQLFEDCLYTSEQFNIILDSCPEKVLKSNDLDSVPLICSETKGLAMAVKHDPEWESAKGMIDSSLAIAKKGLQSMEKLNKINLFTEECKGDTGLDVVTKGDLSLVDKLLSQLEEINGLIVGVCKGFEFEVFGNCVKSSLANSLYCLNEKIECKLKEMRLTKEEIVVNNTEEESILSNNSLKQSISNLTNKLLFIIQEYYKKHAAGNSSGNDSKGEMPQPSLTTPDQADGYLEENHLKEKLLNSFEKDCQLLKIDEVYSELCFILKSISKIRNAREADICKGLLKWVLPLLDQVILLSQFYLTTRTKGLRMVGKLCTTLCQVFVDLTAKGYNIPEELLFDCDEEEGEGQNQSGMGLGDGIGEKDVSDQIESQDQLEGAQQQGQEQQDEEQQETKEEENGVEMSDDFGGQLEDVEKKKEKEGEDDSDDDNDDADKEMADTEKGADLLDQQVWGGDSEEEEDDEEDKEMKEEDRGERGEQEGEAEMGAKQDDDKREVDQREQENGKSEKKDKESVNPNQEPEVDEDHVDPYYGNHEPYPEVEPLDLDDDLQLDEGEDKEEEENENEAENPFDIDKMKECIDEENDKEGKSDEENADEKMDDGGGNENDEEESDDGEEGDNKIDTHMQDDDDDATNQNDNEEEEDPSSAMNEDNKMEEGEETNEDGKNDESEAMGSHDKPSETSVEASQQKYGSKDQVKGDKETEMNKANEDSGAKGEEEEGVGASEAAEEEGGHQGSTGTGKRKGEREAEEKRDHKPGQSDQDRTLGEISEPLKKKLKTIGTEKGQDDEDKEGDKDIEHDEAADFYQHIKEAKGEEKGAQTIDAATQEQAEKLPVPNKDDENGDEPGDEPMQLDEDEDVPSDVDDNVAKEECQPIDGDDDKEISKEKKTKGTKEGELTEETAVEVEGEYVLTEKVPRGSGSMYCTMLDQLNDFDCIDESRQEAIRNELNNQLASWNQRPADNEALSAWDKLCCVTSDLARELSEQLRLVLEPTTAASLKGDFRTGKRINMRKVIPYIASQFRKDKIWLRRTKPSKREYQIILAVDDSSSMADNQSKELAFESLALVSKALSLLEAGELSVLSFGENVQILHKLGEPFNEQSGARLLQEFSFDQKRTKLGGLVDFAVELLGSAPSRGRSVGSDIAQLLVVISDGRGVMSEGEEVVRSAVRTATINHLFIVFIIIDNPNAKDTILDIRMPKFKDGKLLEISSYMDNFPFPFYVILRDIKNLPNVLSDALRQWFELVSNVH